MPGLSLFLRPSAILECIKWWLDEELIPMLLTRYPASKEIDAITVAASYKASRFGRLWTDLPSVGSGGRTVSPKLALVFINPTARNQSAGENWLGERAPFIGLSRVWQLLADAGLIDRGVVSKLGPDGRWRLDEANRLYRHIASRGLYITNLVKACSYASDMPSMKMAREFGDLLIAELEIVRPRLVVSMGVQVTTVLSQAPVRLRDEYRHFLVSGQLRRRPITGTDLSLVPSYFPVGRGNPARAREMIGSLI